MVSKISEIPEHGQVSLGGGRYLEHWKSREVLIVRGNRTKNRGDTYIVQGWKSHGGEEYSLVPIKERKSFRSFVNGYGPKGRLPLEAERLHFRKR